MHTGGGQTHFSFLLYDDAPRSYETLATEDDLSMS
jgi:hypothetical protein